MAEPAGPPARVEAASRRSKRGMKAARRRFYFGPRRSETPEWAVARAQAIGNGELPMQTRERE